MSQNKQKSRPSLKDVADHVGVTKMTVSRFMRSPEQVSLLTRDKIAKAVDDLGYIHNRAPMLLSKASTKTIGVLLPSLSNQIFASFTKGIESVTNQLGYEMLIAHYGYDEDMEENKIASLLSYQIDGIILTGTTHTDKSIKMLKNSKVPVVESMELTDKPIDMVVGLNHKEAAYAAVKSLLEKGRTKIAYFGDRLDVRTKHRMEGYDRAILEYGLKKHHFLTPNHSSFTLGRELLNRALTECPDLDGIFCNNDDIAVGAILACQDRGIKIPDDISILGYNALDVGQAISPILTSVYTPRYEMGETCANILIDSIEGRPRKQKSYDLGFTITTGKSC